MSFIMTSQHGFILLLITRTEVSSRGRVAQDMSDLTGRGNLADRVQVFGTSLRQPEAVILI